MQENETPFVIDAVEKTISYNGDFRMYTVRSFLIM